MLNHSVVDRMTSYHTSIQRRIIKNRSKSDWSMKTPVEQMISSMSYPNYLQEDVNVKLIRTKFCEKNTFQITLLRSWQPRHGTIDMMVMLDHMIMYHLRFLLPPINHWNTLSVRCRENLSQLLRCSCIRCVTGFMPICSSYCQLFDITVSVKRLWRCLCQSMSSVLYLYTVF